MLGHRGLAGTGDVAAFPLRPKLVGGVGFKVSFLSIHLPVSPVITDRGTRAVYFVKDRPQGSFLTDESYPMLSFQKDKRTISTKADERQKFILPSLICVHG